MSATLLLSGVASAGLVEGIAAFENNDFATALQEFKTLAAQKDAGAQFNLGVMYANGQGVSQDYKEAVKWYRLAAAQGYASAQFNLGVSYAKGQGVSQDYKEAVKWYRLAAAQENAYAQSNLGAMYANGQGVFSNRVIAYALFNLSASEDSSSENTATENRENLSKGMPSNEINAGQSLTRELAKPGMFLKALESLAKEPYVKKR